MIQHRIRTLRTLKGISQKDMAERLHKSPSAYNRMEKGEIKITIDELPEIAEILGCSVDDLLQDEIIINIQKNNKKVYAQQVQTQNNTVEDLTEQFRLLLKEVLNFEQQSEERMRSFMQAVLKNLSANK